MPQATLNDIKAHKIRVLIYGPSGDGKTFLSVGALKVLEMRPVFIADFDGGLASVKEELEAEWDTGDVTVWRMLSPEDISVLVKACVSGKYKTVIIDSVTEMHNLLLEMVKIQAKRRDRPTQLQDYGTVMTNIYKLLRTIREKETVNLIMIATETIVEDEINGGFKLFPAVPGKMATGLPAFFDMVGYLKAESIIKGGVRDVVRTLQVQPYDNRYAKDRLTKGRLGLALEEPTIAKIYEAVYKGGSFEATPKEEKATGLDNESANQDDIDLLAESTIGEEYHG